MVDMTGIKTTGGLPGKTPDRGNRPPNRRRALAICCAAMLLLAAATLAMMVRRGKQAASSIPISLRFIGEYSQNGGEWQTLTEDTRFNALNGDLYLRGRFDLEKDEAPIHAYLDNISMTVLVDGEEEKSLLISRPDESESAGTQWIGWTSRAFAAKTVEIHLSNPNAVGNPNAYNDFLSKLYVGPNQKFESYILSPGDFLIRSVKSDNWAQLTEFLQSGQFWRGIGFGVFVLALILLGIALADSLQSGLFGRKLWLLGVLSLFSVGAIVLDTPDVSLWHMNIAFNTYGAQLCRMLWMLTLSLLAAELLTGRGRLAAFAAALLGGIFDAGVYLLFLLGNTYVTDILAPWFWLQAVICLTLIIACVPEIKRAPGPGEKGSLALLLLIVCGVAAELCNGCFGLWQRGLLLHSVLALTLLLCGVHAIKGVPAAYRAAKEAARLKDELTQNRVSIMLSQIQPHFLYNSLNTIYYLCGKDQQAAQAAISDFSDYLRTNLDSLKATVPVPFERELKHIQTYLSLEKMRFTDKLAIEYNIETTDFLLPALTVQPLVENAVKYGVGKKSGGGTVTITTRDVPGAVEIVVSDDGVGYDPAATQDDGRSHIGLDNVRARLAAMSGGSLRIESTPGKGTIATITIPKEERR